jgi:ribonuclease HI
MKTHPDRKQSPVTLNNVMPPPAGFADSWAAELSSDQSADHPTEVDSDVRSEYLLVCEAKSSSLAEGHWHFTLECADGSPVLEAGDEELGDLNRLTLLAAVRGLEAIDGAASVTLLSNNRYLIRSLTDSLPRWRENDFVWEHFGRRIDVQHADLWRRISGAVAIHRVEACLISSRLISTGGVTASGHQLVQQRIDSPHNSPTPPAQTTRRSATHAPAQDRLRRWLLAGATESGAAPRHRFTSADLMERE